VFILWADLHIFITIDHSMQRSITVLLVDAAEASRAQIRYYLAEFPIFTIVGEASSFDAMLAAVGRHHPDLVVLDDALIDGTGTDVLEMFNGNLSGRIVFISAYMHDQKKILPYDPLGILFKPVSRPRFVALLQGISDLFLLEEAEHIHRQE
jgi:response regulator of citrate/malate metabolism